jgi:hypothetical protein
MGRGMGSRKVDQLDPPKFLCPLRKVLLVNIVSYEKGLRPIKANFVFYLSSSYKCKARVLVTYENNCMHDEMAKLNSKKLEK